MKPILMVQSLPGIATSLNHCLQLVESLEP